MTLSNVIGYSQRMAMKEGLKGDECAYFSSKIENLKNTLRAMPRTYGTDGQGNKAIAYLHYFRGGNDWYITELDEDSSQIQAFGVASLLGNDPEMGYINIQELIKYGVELDLHFNPSALKDLNHV